MLDYAAALFVRKDGEAYLEFPQNIYDLSGFSRFKSFRFSLAVVTDEDRAPLLERRESIYVHLIPFPSRILERLFYLEVALKGQANTLAPVLTWLKSERINIWDCRSIDTYDEGRAELVVALERPLRSEGRERQEDELRNIIRGGLASSIVGDIKVEKPLDNTLAVQLVDTRYDAHWSAEFSHEVLFKKESGKLFLTIPPESSFVDSPKNSKLHKLLAELCQNNYVSVIFDSRAKLVKAAFRDPDEIIVRFKAHFFLERHGQLEGVVAPLGRLAVDLRLIQATITQENIGGATDAPGPDPSRVAYDIIGNIHRTKFSLFDEDTLGRLVRQEIQAAAQDPDVPDLVIDHISTNKEKLVNIHVGGFESHLVRRSTEEIELVGLKKGIVFYDVQPGRLGENAYLMRLLCDIGKDDTLYLFKCRIVAQSLELLRSVLTADDILELVRQALLFTFMDLREKGREWATEVYESAFLIEVSDAIYSAFLATHCIALCEELEDIERRSRLKELFGEVSIHFQYVKYGLAPFVGHRRTLYLFEGERYNHKFKRCVFSTDEAAAIRKSIEEFVDLLKVAALLLVNGERLDGEKLGKIASNAVALRERLLGSRAERVLEKIENRVTQSLKRKPNG